MEATLTKKKQSYVFDRKLTDEEIRELIDNFDYEAYEEETSYDDYVPAPVWDRFGNPTRDTIAARYEVEHGLIEGPMTVDEFFAELDALREEIDNEKNRTNKSIQEGFQAHVQRCVS